MRPHRIEIGGDGGLHPRGLGQLHEQAAAELAGADDGHADRTPAALALGQQVAVEAHRVTVRPVCPASRAARQRARDFTASP